MRAWRVEQWCDPDGMRWVEADPPEPGAGQVRIKVAAAALNFLDTLMIAGKYQVKPALPFTPGVELAGVVDAAGPGSRHAVGTRVCANVPTGGYAEYAVADDAAAAAVPEGIDLAVAATLPIVFPTAHLCLRDAGRLAAGETVLVTAAAGGVGLATIQLAKAWGAARVIALAGGEAKLAVCRDLGADVLIDYNRPDWFEQARAAAGPGADIVVDMVGGAVAEQALRLLAWRGRFVVVGFAGGAIPAIAANRLLLKSATAVGVFWGATAQKEPQLAAAVFADLFRMVSDGSLRPIVTRRYALADAPQAMKDLASRATAGKVVLVP